MHCFDIAKKWGHSVQIEYLRAASSSEEYSVLLRKKSKGLALRFEFLPASSLIFLPFSYRAFCV
jgi:hypothetical protein